MTLAIPILPNHADAAWFACLGLPLAPGELREARGYLEALGYPPDTRITAAPAGKQAESITRDPDWDRTWWAREEAERERLMHLFVRKYALFESGRWPLGVVGGVFYLF